MSRPRPFALLGVATRGDDEYHPGEYTLRVELPVDDGCPLRFPEDRGRELRLIEAVRSGEAGSVDELRHLFEE